MGYWKLCRWKCTYSVACHWQLLWYYVYKSREMIKRTTSEHSDILLSFFVSSPRLDTNNDMIIENARVLSSKYIYSVCACVCSAFSMHDINVYFNECNTILFYWFEVAYTSLPWGLRDSDAGWARPINSSHCVNNIFQSTMARAPQDIADLIRHNEQSMTTQQLS